MRLNNFKLALLLCSFIFLPSCGAHGPAFSPVEITKPDKALVYIYRPASFIGGANSFKIWINDKHVTDLSNGGYYVYMAEPGELLFKIKTKINPLNFGLAYALWEKQKEVLALNVEAGKTYYVRRETNPESFGHNIAILASVDEETGSQEIIKCQQK